MIHFSAKQKPVIASLVQKGHKVALTVETEGCGRRFNVYHFNDRRFTEFKEFWEWANFVKDMGWKA